MVHCSTQGRACYILRNEAIMDVNMSEAARLIVGLRKAGWSDTAINNLILYLETGNSEYLPKDQKEVIE